MIAENLLRVLDDGRRTGTHKLALLLGIIDALELASDDLNHVPETLPVQAIARPLVARMWQQVTVFVPPGSDVPAHLRQMRPNGRGGYHFWEITQAARDEAERRGLADLDQLETEDPGRVARLEEDVVKAAVKNPVPRLQMVGGDLVEFLYRWPWGTDRTPRAVAREQGRGDEEPHLEFVDDAAEELLRLAPVLRPVVVERYVHDVASYNNLHTTIESVRDHLFGSGRWQIPRRLRDALHDVQAGRCAYCDRRLEARVDVDHFIPWVWQPNNAVENLVLADPRCNNAKRDRFAAHEHVEQWVEGLSDRGSVGRWLGADLGGVYTDLPRSLGIARRSYTHLTDRRRLWVGPDEEPRPADGRELAAVMAALDAAPSGARGRRTDIAAEALPQEWGRPSDTG